MKWFNCSCLTILSLSLPFLAISQTASYTNPDSKVFIANTALGIPASDRKLFKINENGENLVSITGEIGLVYGLAVDEVGKKVYRVEATSGQIFRTDLDGSNEEEIMISGLNYPVAIAVDGPNSKIYWSEQGSNTIKRANLDGTLPENVVINLASAPHDLELDLQNRLVYWTEPDAQRIRRGNMDSFNSGGTTVLTNSVSPRYLALDVNSSTVFWTNSSTNAVYKADFAGTDMQALITDVVGSPRDIEVANGKIYWANNTQQKVQRSDLDGTNVEDLVIGLSEPEAVAICEYCPSCDDLVQNGNETDTDCGGTDCLVCSGNDLDLQLTAACVMYDPVVCAGTDPFVTVDIYNPNAQDWRGTITFVWEDISDNTNRLEVVYGNTNFVISGNSTNQVIVRLRTASLDPGDFVLKIYESYYDGTFQPEELLQDGPNCTNTFAVTIEDCSNCNFTDVTDAIILAAADCLCALDYIIPQDYGNGNTNGVQPNGPIYRADLAKLVYYTLFKSGSTTGNPVLNFPTPFQDLEEEFTDPYYDYGKILSYLTYQDGLTPFDRDFANFHPYRTIEKRYALKVILEALNIPPDESGPSPFPDEITADEDGYGYIKKAVDLGLATPEGVKSPISRGEVFIILHQYIQLYGDGSCTTDYAVPTVNDNTDYYIPGNLLSQSLSRFIGMMEGFFTHTAKAAFYIPGINLPLQFQHFYNAYLTDAPQSWHRLEPLGAGWSHTYNAYIVEEKSYSPVGLQSDKLYVVWPDKQVHRYDKLNLKGESIGVFDELIANGSNYTVRKKNQMKYDFTKYYLGDDPTQLDSLWMLTAIRDRNENTIVINIEQIDNGIPRIASVTGTSGLRQLVFSYQAETNYLEKVEDTAGSRMITFQVDNESKDLLRYVNPRQDPTIYNYGSGLQVHLLQNIQLPRGNTITAGYNANRKLQSIVLPEMPEPLDFNISENHGIGKYTSSITLPGSNITIQSEFNDLGQILNSTNNETTTLINYQADLHLPESVTYGKKDTPAEQITTTFNYDERGNLTKIFRPMGVVDSFAYNELNDLIRRVDPKEYESEIFYDANNNLDYVLDNMGHKTDYTINDKGQLESVENAEDIVVTFEYDAYGNRTRTTAPLNLYQKVNYDPMGRPTQITLPEGRVTAFNYDFHDQITQKILVGETENLFTTYRYDKNDNLIEIENEVGGITKLIYNDRDLLEKFGFGNDTTRYEYRDDNLLNNYTKPDGTLMNISHDVQGRIFVDGYAQYTYDNQNNVKTIRRLGETPVTEFNYDELNRIDDYTDIYGKAVDYQYDKNHNVTQIIYPGGFTVNYEYDPNNRLEFVRWNNGSQVIQYTYLMDGRLQRMDYPNGTNTTYSYDAAGRMTGMANLKSTTTDTICAYTYTLDSLGNHLSEVGQEPLDLTQLSEVSYTGTFNEENELVSYQGQQYSFDANGNQIARSGTTSTWDEADRMTSYGGQQYTYDGMGTLRRAVRDGMPTRYVWDIRGMGNILLETDDNGNPRFYYIYGLGLAARIEAATNTTHFYHYDFRGSTIAMTDESENITHSYKYLPFGELWQEQEANSNAFKYVGRWGVMAEGDDLYYMRARFYDAQTGRFLSEDPVWGENLFAYGGSNPINMIDPLGKKEENILEPLTGKWRKWFDRNKKAVQKRLVSFYSDAVSIADIYAYINGIGSSTKLLPFQVLGVTYKYQLIEDEKDKHKFYLGLVVEGGLLLINPVLAFVISKPADILIDQIVEENYMTNEQMNRIYLEVKYGPPGGSQRFEPYLEER